MKKGRRIGGSIGNYFSSQRGGGNKQQFNVKILLSRFIFPRFLFFSFSTLLLSLIFFFFFPFDFSPIDHVPLFEGDQKMLFRKGTSRIALSSSVFRFLFFKEGNWGGGRAEDYWKFFSRKVVFFFSRLLSCF